jgi:hypothetical protein
MGHARKRSTTVNDVGTGWRGGGAEREKGEGRRED